MYKKDFNFLSDKDFNKVMEEEMKKDKKDIRYKFFFDFMIKRKKKIN
tara:strand:- start:332 stop:472 length:141 start_codon:yes stop_codon:yes gene_type:complete